MSQSERIAELEASRARILTASDQGRRQIERALHDGVQQRLVTLSLEARLAATQAAQEGSADLHAKLCQLAESLDEAFEQLRTLARRIHPAVVSHGGLGAALRSLARQAPLPVTLDLGETIVLPEALELSAYYVVAEALDDLAEHAGASSAWIRAELSEGHLELEVRDDGVGAEEQARREGLIGVRDRVEAHGGRLHIAGVPSGGTSVLARIPLSDRGSG